MIRAATARALTMAGLHPGIGLFHHNRSNSFPLADDMMEIWRPFIDYRVWQISHTSQKQTEDIKPEHKKQLLSLFNETVRFTDDKLPLELAIQRSSASLAQCMTDKSEKLVMPVAFGMHQLELAL